MTLVTQVEGIIILQSFFKSLRECQDTGVGPGCPGNLSRRLILGLTVVVKEVSGSHTTLATQRRTWDRPQGPQAKGGSDP